jgi:hypothetical protein
LRVARRVLDAHGGRGGWRWLTLSETPHRGV